ncbi:MAG TPA: DUF4097 family beta strand repeat-containing protein [Candidatus Angelobacter sp.]|nr:DUF4097 family beta strand repeat-containing protein [Candidatus Angelobacter sp.]
MMRFKKWLMLAALVILWTPAFSSFSSLEAQEQTAVFQRVLTMGLSPDPLVLDIALSRGDLNIRYQREGEIRITGFAKTSAGKKAAAEFFKSGLVITQDKQHVTFKNAPNAPDADVQIELDVPYRTELNSVVTGTGNQKLIGIAGPAKLQSGEGDIDVTFVRLGLVQIRTGKGKITCTRVIQLDVETGEGNITLLEDGIVRAAIKKGPGRMEVGGVRDTLEAATDGGLLHIKAVPNGDWKLKSGAGNIRVELPPKSGFDIAASTTSGNISSEREDVKPPEGSIHEFQQKVNGGGKHIQVQSVRGNISIE